MNSYKIHAVGNTLWVRCMWIYQVHLQTNYSSPRNRQGKSKEKKCNYKCINNFSHQSPILWTKPDSTKPFLNKGTNWNMIINLLLPLKKLTFSLPRLSPNKSRIKENHCKEPSKYYLIQKGLYRISLVTDFFVLPVVRGTATYFPTFFTDSTICLMVYVCPVPACPVRRMLWPSTQIRTASCCILITTAGWD